MTGIGFLGSTTCKQPQASNYSTEPNQPSIHSASIAQTLLSQFNCADRERTHPNPENRIERIEQAINELYPNGVPDNLQE